MCEVTPGDIAVIAMRDNSRARQIRLFPVLQGGPAGAPVMAVEASSRSVATAASVREYQGLVILVVKDSWQYPEREEGEMLREITEKGVVNPNTKRTSWVPDLENVKDCTGLDKSEYNYWAADLSSPANVSTAEIILTTMWN
jgi:hypothetical protein